MPSPFHDCPTCGVPTRALRCWSCYRTETTFEERFWAKVDTSGGLFACWPWTGAIQTGTRYGAIKSAGGVTGAHRVSLAISLGRDLGPGMEACHTCDNPPCVNPAHLFEGTKADNARDMAAKGRSFAQTRPEDLARGERAGNARLTEELVIRIRARRAEGLSYPRLAAEFGIAISHAQRIAKGAAWAHIPLEAARV